MNLVTLSECKERLSIDFDTKDNEISIMANSIESKLFIGAGINSKRLAEQYKDKELILNESQKEIIENTYNTSKEYVLFKLYLDYYNAHTELDDRRLTSMMKDLQVLAVLL
jgi:hypothetical protein